MFQRLALILSISLFWTAPASAGLLSLVGQHLTWDTQQTSSPTFVVAVTNPSAASDLLFGWQLSLVVMPSGGAVGTVEFHSATLPSDYLLDGRSDGLVPTFNGPSTSIGVIADSDSLFDGIPVPTFGANLLQVDFLASPDARGLFEVTVVPGLFQGANWFSSDFQARDFANVPFDADPIVIGTIRIVAVPEVHSVFVISAFGIGAIVYRLGRVRRKNNETDTQTA